MENAAPKDSPYAWTMVAIGGLMGCIAIGAVFSLAVFLQPMAQDTGWSRTAISSAMTLNFVAMGVGSFAWGALSDRFGVRVVVLAGSVVLGLGLALASRAATETQFLLVYGILVGAAAGSIFVPLITAVSGWFEKRRGLAVSLVSAGMGMAPLTMSPLSAWLIERMDWRSGQLTMAVIVWVIMIPLALLVRAPGAAPKAQGAAGAEAPRGGVAAALRSWPFIVLALTFFACCATHSGPIFHTVSYAITCGIPTMAAVSAYSVEGLAGLGGRIVWGMLADRVGAKPVLIAGLFVQALAAGAFMYARQIEHFYVIGAVFGFAYGGVMPLYAVLARDYFGQRILGTILGAATMLSAFGMALGPALGGWIFDTYGRYTGLYVFSFAIGIAAAMIAFAFPRAGGATVAAPRSAA
jgi:MFS family permease